MPISRRALLRAGAGAGVATLAGCGSGTATSSGDSQIEVFSWWSGPGEKEGLDALVADYKARNPSVDFNNAAVAGGAGTNARAVLASRLAANDPPDSYQVHAGLELQSDIRAGKCE